MSSEDSAEEALENDFYEDFGEVIDEEFSSDDASKTEMEGQIDNPFLTEWVQAGGGGDVAEHSALLKNMVNYWKDVVPQVGWGWREYARRN